MIFMLRTRFTKTERIRQKKSEISFGKHCLFIHFKEKVIAIIDIKSLIKSKYYIAVSSVAGIKLSYPSDPQNSGRPSTQDPYRKLAV